MRLERYLSKTLRCSKQQSRAYIHGKRVRMANQIQTDPKTTVSQYCDVWLDDRCLQEKLLHYYMLHKPKGFLSATTDEQHPTVMELLPEDVRDKLHIAGRLDLHSSGLLLLTSDGRWSRKLTEPKEGVGKTYVVDLAYPICPDTQDKFAKGIPFQPENIVTQPAQLELITPSRVRLTIYEGRYHQIKRMFAYVGNRVVGIHREGIGPIALERELEEGFCRPLTEAEIACFQH